MIVWMVGSRIAAAFAVGLAAGLVVGMLVGRPKNIPFMRRTRDWAIGIYVGNSPLAVAPAVDARNPVLTIRDVTDVRAESVCDPFIVERGGTWSMFFEVVNADLERKQIGLATSRDGLKWTYQRIALSEPFDVSYPYVFEWQGEYYMLPETPGLRSVRLYKATKFPTDWRSLGVILDGAHFEAPSIVRYQGRWWLFAGAGRHDILRVFYAPDLTGPWTEHPKSPVLWENPAASRPSGRMLVLDGNIVRFAQDCSKAYGTQVWAYLVTELTPTRYGERRLSERPIIGPAGEGWNGDGMHHFDAHQVGNGRWMAYVDGWTLTRKFRRGGSP